MADLELGTFHFLHSVKMNMALIFQIFVISCIAAAKSAYTHNLHKSGSSIHPYTNLLHIDPIPVLVPQQHQHVVHELEHAEEHAPAHYSFNYEVNDPHTGDWKNQHEERSDHVLKGSYSLVQPDGLRRIVEYSDEGAGFVALVRYEDSGIKIPEHIIAEHGIPIRVAAHDDSWYPGHKGTAIFSHAHI